MEFFRTHVWEKQLKFLTPIFTFCVPTCITCHSEEGEEKGSRGKSGTLEPEARGQALLFLLGTGPRECTRSVGPSLS